MKRRTFILTGLLMPIASAAAQPDRGRDDAAKLITLAGAIVKSRYENPDVTITVETRAKQWTVTLAPTTRLTNRGVSPDMIAPGRTVIVSGYASAADESEVRAERITLGGKTFEMR